jgi:hypothetical protein
VTQHLEGVAVAQWPWSAAVLATVGLAALSVAIAAAVVGVWLSRAEG